MAALVHCPGATALRTELGTSRVQPLLRHDWVFVVAQSNLHDFNRPLGRNVERVLSLFDAVSPCRFRVLHGDVVDLLFLASVVVPEVDLLDRLRCVLTLDLWNAHDVAGLRHELSELLVVAVVRVVVDVAQLRVRIRLHRCKTALADALARKLRVVAEQASLVAVSLFLALHQELARRCELVS